MADFQDPELVADSGWESAKVRSLLDQLLADSRLYTRGEDYQQLLDFVVRLRNFAPFNAMLLQVQKPGLSYAATSHDWRHRFGRWPKEGARPLLILWPFGPVALVYDVLETEGKTLPTDVRSFQAVGSVDGARVRDLQGVLERRNIEWISVDAGDRNAGLIRVVRRAVTKDEATQYRIHINRNHEPVVQFVTLAHELGHLFLGHLGPDKKLNVPLRVPLSHSQREIEAESVAFIVCERNGISSKSQQYLTNYVKSETTIDSIDVYQVMRAAGQVEALLGLAVHTKFGPLVSSNQSEG